MNHRKAEAVALMAGTALMALSGPAVAGDILAVHSYHAGYEWDAGWKRGLENTLSGHNIDHFYMDTKRLPESEFDAKANEAWAQFQSGDYDLVVLGDDNAASYLGQRIVDNSDVPVVFHGINGNPRLYFEDSVLGEQATGILERPLMGMSLTVIRKALPETERVLVLFDKGITGEASKGMIEDIDSAVDDIELDVRLLSDFGKWKELVRTAEDKGYDVIAPGLYNRQRDESGEAVPAEKVITWTHENSSLPLLGFWGFAVGEKKAMAGAVFDGEIMGTAAGQHVRQILEKGEVPRPTPLQQGKLVVSESGLKRWDIDMPEFSRLEMQRTP